MPPCAHARAALRVPPTRDCRRRTWCCNAPRPCSSCSVGRTALLHTHACAQARSGMRRTDELAVKVGSAPLEGDDLVADAGEHAADLVVAPLGERELGFARRNHVQTGGGAGRFLVGQNERAGGEERGDLGDAGGRNGRGESGAVDFRDLVFGRREAMDERALVGE